jgi:hypothetical protein
MYSNDQEDEIDIGDNMRALLVDLCEVDDAIKELTKRREELKRNLGEMNRMGTMSIGTHEVSITKHAGNRTLSKDLLKEAGIDPDNYMKQGKPYVRMVVKKLSNNLV